MDFKLVSNYQPTGDQPQAIQQLVDGLNQKQDYQTLLGVTGSGKTFTIANVINKVNTPTLVLSHNKTLAAQLYSEFKQFFPNNLVEYFVSYYDYYQPEAYIPSTGTYIEKDLSINDEIEKLRLNTTSSLLSGRKDIIVVSSVSCIYGIGNPQDFHNRIFEIKTGDKITINELLQNLILALYSRSTSEFARGNFRVKGDTIDIFSAHSDTCFRILFFDDEIEEIESINPENGRKIESLRNIKIYPANIFITSKDRVTSSIRKIKDDLLIRLKELDELNLKLESERLSERVNFDLEMIRELGYCSGIENYSRYFDGRNKGERPFCLLDYFPKEFLTVVDESHVTIPQIRAMYGGDKSRKTNLVEHGFRLPSALDNRPLKFEEWELINQKTIFMSATPADYEIEKSQGSFTEQIIRPTGLLEPEISIHPSKDQIDHLIEEIQLRVNIKERTLVTTLTKRMAEELTKYFSKFNIKCTYIHSDVDTLERIEILHNLKQGKIDVLIGVNLLREGLDLPEVSLVAILDADKEGFLRSERSLTQTAGRAARNLNGKVIMYADKITRSMKHTIDETNRKRKKQIEYNKKHNIIPKAILRQEPTEELNKLNPYLINNKEENINQLKIKDLNKKQLSQLIKNTKIQMEEAAKNLDFTEAIKLRDKLFKLEKKK
tara:strand:- start:715 stop:2700 length:1986 start_codon:yes stop_codon:yes gene_type:complete